jgi:hypothetical protein
MYPKFRGSGSEAGMSKEMITSQDDARVVHPSPSRDLDLDRVRAAVKGIRFGEVRVIIQDGVVVQIERLEKQRLR